MKDRTISLRQLMTALFLALFPLGTEQLPGRLSAVGAAAGLCPLLAGGIAVALGARPGGDARMEGELGLVGKGVEALSLQRLGLQACRAPSGCAAVCPQSALLRRFGTDSRPSFITPAAKSQPGSVCPPGG